MEKDHGRIETRRCFATGALDWLAVRGAWEKLRAVCVVEAPRESGAHTSTERRYYLAQSAAGGRAAGPCRVRTGHAATNLATLRHLALNLLRRDTTTKRGIRCIQKIADWNHRYLLTLLKS